LGLSHSGVLYQLQKLGIPRRRGPFLPVPPPNLKKPNLNPSSHLAFILGALLGDGTVNHYQDGHSVISFRVTDSELANSYRKSLQFIGLNSSYHISDGLHCVTAYSKVFVDWFRQLSIDDIDRATKDYRVEVIRGLYDAEGSLSSFLARGEMTPSCRIEISNSKQELIEWLATILKEAEFKPHMWEREEHRSKTLYLLSISGRLKVRSFINLIKPTSHKKCENCCALRETDFQCLPVRLWRGKRKDGTLTA